MNHINPDFNRIVAAYEQWAEPFTAPFSKEAVALANVGPSSHVIDVACGTGALSLFAALRGATVLATDVAAAMATRAQQRLQTFDLCDAAVMDAEHLTAQDQTFDASFSMFGVLMFPHWRDCLSELARVTKPGGVIVVSAWEAPEGASPMVLLKQAFDEVFPERNLWPTGQFPVWSNTDLQTAFSDVNCEHVKVHNHQIIWDVANSDQLIEDTEDIWRLSPVYSNLGDDERRLLREPLQEILLRYLNKAERIQIPIRAPIAIAVKR